MKITTKINIMTTAWILCVLVAVNVVVFFSFMKVTVNMEDQELYQRANTLIKEMKLDQSTNLVKDQVIPYLAGQSFIRIVEPGSKITHEVTNAKLISAKVKPKFVQKKVAERKTIHQKNGEEEILVIRVPIRSDGKILRSLEIGEKLSGLELAKDVLLSIQISSTVLGALLAMLGGRWLSNLIMRPISNMINTMEDIEQSGIPKKIVIQHETKDELQKMAVTFNRMIGRLEENLEKQKQFISDASHELKTPLTVIKSFADHLLRRGIRNEADALDAIETIHSEATRIQKMTERFLDLAATESATLLETKSLDLVVLCGNISKQLQSAYKRDIHLHYAAPSIMVTADELKLKQAIIILIDNAIKYSTDKIDVFLNVNEQNTVIKVKDYGIGIPEYEINNIFERFYRVDKARSRETGGTGLGLAIAKNIMKQHHGEVKISSKEGIGTEAELYLPKSERKDNE